MFHKSYINDFVMKKYNGTRGYLELLKINISTTFEKNDFFVFVSSQSDLTIPLL